MVASPLTNLVRCQNGNCHHTLDWDGSNWPDPERKSYPCPITSCDAGRMTMRCGGLKINGERCYKLCQAGSGCSEHPKDGSEPSSSFKDQGGARGKSAQGNSRKKKNSASLLPGGNEAGKPGSKPGTYMAPHLRAAYEKVRADRAAQGALIHEIGMHRARLDELQRQLEGGEGPSRTSRLKSFAKKLRTQIGKIQEYGRPKAQGGDPVKANAANRKILKQLTDDLLPYIEGGIGPEEIWKEIRENTKRIADLQRTKALIVKPRSVEESEALVSRLLIVMDQILRPSFEEYPGLVGRWGEFLIAIKGVMEYDPRDPFEVPVGLPEVVDSGNGRPGEKVIEAAGSG